jgi:hypothetical protein
VSEQSQADATALAAATANVATLQAQVATLGAVLGFGGTNTATGEFLARWGSNDAIDATENNIKKITIPRACKLKAAYARVTTAPGAGETTTFVVRVNGVDSALTAVVSDAAVTGSGTSAGGIAVAAGAVITVREDLSGGAAAGGVSTLELLVDSS